ncbi:hypothetical protein P186_0158 [Pyrobaculum ferrireducens]|uniref:Uncharacterized protein n=2 Tax=Pyrobaculum ferrireducens TaxID=1104324 RepID=G7VEJ5_9CREN|nr:hypothetical protein P186_0158 [Pyrobaculum ferrireducens]
MGELWRCASWVLGGWVHDAWNAVYADFYEGWATRGASSRGVERVSRLVEELADRVLEWAGGGLLRLRVKTVGWMPLF